MVSVGRPSGALYQSACPVFLSSERKRCAPAACAPQVNVRPLTMTWSPSTIGDDMRPPCVVHIPNSSASDRSHSSLPSFESASTSPLPLIANTWPVAGSTAGDDQAIRCGGTSLVNRLYLYSQRSAPVSAWKHITRSCNVG